ncbi:MAG: ChrR family anti-sigma-E factor [Alphaproteobacteria bacterium]|jgi:putative transcriptional regulator|nr:cupin domain-containing protein [Thalassospira sp.]MCE2964923.1 ChrR family anti-sigma-E factor [Alphaproteobacteria bacterium]
MASFHPDADLLLRYSAGTCGAALQLAISSHLALCNECAYAVQRLDAISGMAISEAQPTLVSKKCLQQIFDRCKTPVTAQPAAQVTDTYPAPLSGLISQNPLKWESRGKDIQQAILLKEQSGTVAYMMKIRKGAEIPEHNHRGDEFVLILEGSMIDQRGATLRGDFVTTDAAFTHKPRAGDDADCVCLVVATGGVKFTKGLLRVLNVLPWQ